MNSKLIISIICVGLAAGLRVTAQQTQSPIEVTNHNQKSEKVSQKQPLSSAVITILEHTSNQSKITADNKQHITDYYQHTASYRDSTDGKYKITVSHHQPIANQSQHITDQHRNETDQPSKNQPTTNQFRPTSGNYKLTTRKYKASTQPQQSLTKLVQLSISQYPPAQATKTLSFYDKLDLTDDIFLCNDGKFRIMSSSKCNGQIDCPDGSDELPGICPTTSSKKCSSEEFQCPSGKCISKKHHSDENSCDDYAYNIKQPDYPCSEYCCNSGTCIYNNQVCDGVNDCGDNSDETSCDDNISFWSDNKTLIISLSALGGALLLTTAAVFAATICYRRKYKAIQTEINRMGSQPPPYWQVVGEEAPVNSDNKCEQKCQGYENLLFDGPSVFPV